MFHSSIQKKLIQQQHRVAIKKKAISETLNRKEGGQKNRCLTKKDKKTLCLTPLKVSIKALCLC